MKKVIILVVAVALSTMSFISISTKKEKTLKVSVEDSTIHWKGYKPTGSHEGTINLISGELNLEDGVIKGGSFTVDMPSIKDVDESARLEKHLKSADFFDVETFNTSTFTITSTEDKDGKTVVTGDLTIKGITKQISFLATITQTDEMFTLTSETIQINRAEFNIKYKSKTFFNNLKEKFINNDFDLQVTIVASK